MSIISSIGSSTREGLYLLTSQWLFTIYVVLSLASIYQLTSFHFLISDFIGSQNAFIFMSYLFLSTTLSIIVGCGIHHKVGKKFHVLWNLFGVVYAIFLLYKMDGLPGLMLYSVLGGVTTGLCVPNIISKFLNSTTFENRGSACGILIFFVYIVVFISAAFIASYVQLALFFLSFKVLALMLLTSKSVLSSKKEELAFLYQPRLVVYLYLFVWFLFLLVDIIVSNIASQRFSRAEIEIINLESVLLGLFTMIIGGALMDNVGRRKLITLAFLYLGVEYSFISLSSGELIRYTFIDGVAWGIITTVFMFVLWGDAIKPGERHLFSAFSMIVALASIYFKNALSILGFRLDFTQTFPLTSIFLFLSVIITSFYLPETLPEKVIQSKELRNYIETAKKIKEKYK